MASIVLGKCVIEYRLLLCQAAGTKKLIAMCASGAFFTIRLMRAVFVKFCSEKFIDTYVPVSVTPLRGHFVNVEGRTNRLTSFL